MTPRISYNVFSHGIRTSGNNKEICRKCVEKRKENQYESTVFKHLSMPVILLNPEKDYFTSSSQNSFCSSFHLTGVGSEAHSLWLHQIHTFSKWRVKQSNSINYAFPPSLDCF